jgi:hypothetical protein
MTFPPGAAHATVIRSRQQASSAEPQRQAAPIGGAKYRGPPLAHQPHVPLTEKH